MQRHFDAALLLAAAVEIPRWTVTFLAIHEPLWVGVPLGALLAYAASEGWKAYFVDNRRWVLLCFNVATLLAATFVITPVLFAMASGPIEALDLTRILPAPWLLAWAGVLAVTTFAPLIQLAAVKAGRARTATPDVADETPDVAPAATPTPVTLRAVAPIAPDVAERSSADIAAQLGVTRQAVDGWKRRGTLRDNIARRLPEVAAPTTNGNGGAHD